jgi:endonuclease-3
MDTWVNKLEPLIKKYGKRKIPLDYHNRYQLVVMVLLAAQSSDNQINKVTIPFFETYPSMSDLKNCSPEDLYPFLKSIRGFRKKSSWLVALAKTIGEDSKIPNTLKELTKLPGIGRKTANVVIRESGDRAEGVVVDLHVVRVAPRLGIVSSTKPEKIEGQLMEVIPQEKWNEIGMTLSFHGRETCRPKPKCDECMVSSVCDYYKTNVVAAK